MKLPAPSTMIQLGIPLGVVGLIVLVALVSPRPEARVVPPAVPVSQVVEHRPVEGDPAAARARRQPSAVVAGELVVPWSTIRTVVASSAGDEAASVLAEDLGDVVETLRRTRRAPDAGPAFSDTLDDLERLEVRVTEDPQWAADARVVAALEHHRAVLARYSHVR